MPLKLKVDYKEKDIVKSLNGKWDTGSKCWYAPDNTKYSDFEKWFYIQNPSRIIKEIYFILLGSRLCWKCNKLIDIISIGALRHLIKSEGNDFEFNSDFIRFEFIKWLPQEVIKEIQSNFSFFKYRYSNTIKNKYWGNDCSKCKAIQGDFFNNHEIGGTFFPQNESEASNIKMIGVKTNYDIPIVASEVDVLHLEVNEARNISDPVNVNYLIAENAKKITFKEI